MIDTIKSFLTAVGLVFCYILLMTLFMLGVVLFICGLVILSPLAIIYMFFEFFLGLFGFFDDVDQPKPHRPW